MHHTRILLLNELLSEIYQRASYSPQPHKGNANKVLYKNFPLALFGEEKKNPNIKGFKIIPLSKPSSFLEAVRCSNSILSTWSLPQRLARGETWQTSWRGFNGTWPCHAANREIPGGNRNYRWAETRIFSVHEFTKCISGDSPMRRPSSHSHPPTELERPGGFRGNFLLFLSHCFVQDPYLPAYGNWHPSKSHTAANTCLSPSSTRARQVWGALFQRHPATSETRNLGISWTAGCIKTVHIYPYIVFYSEIALSPTLVQQPVDAYIHTYYI